VLLVLRRTRARREPLPIFPGLRHGSHTPGSALGHFPVDTAPDNRSDQMPLDVRHARSRTLLANQRSSAPDPEQWGPSATTGDPVPLAHPNRLEWQQTAAPQSEACNTLRLRKAAAFCRSVPGDGDVNRRGQSLLVEHDGNVWHEWPSHDEAHELRRGWVCPGS